jgi:hypothetical protein
VRRTPVGAPPYQPFYCEENAWHLCAHPSVGAGPRAVVFVSNARRTVAFGGQRRGGEDGIIVWDYHVVVVVRRRSGWRVYDPDAIAGEGAPLPDWLQTSFGVPPRFRRSLAPQFRVVEAAVFRADFRSDRAHMRREDGTWSAPPPPWPLIGSGGSNLDQFVAMGTGGPGRRADLEGLVAALDGVVQSSNAP